MKHVVFRIKQILDERNLKQYALAPVLGITPAGVSKMLKDNKLKVSQLKKIADFIEVDPNYLIGYDDDELKSDNSTMRDPLFAYKSQINTIHAGGDVKTSIKDLNECAREVEFLQAKLQSQEELIASLRSDLTTKQSLIDLLSSGRR
jgi:DNA-binding Xre family transcriptional regulator